MSDSKLISYKKISPNRTVNRDHKIDTITIHCMAGDMSVEGCGEWFSKTSTGASSNYGIGSDGRIGLYCPEKDRSWCSSSRSNDMRAVTIEVANCKNSRGGYDADWPVSDKAYNSLINLVADICKRNNIKKLLWKNDRSLIGQVDKQNMTLHMWFKNKDCPGKYLHSHMGDIAEKVNAKLGHSTTEKTKIKPKENYTLHEFRQDVMDVLDIHDINKAFKKTPTISAKTNRRHKLVKYIQKYLNNKGYDMGEVDGIAGTKFTSAIKQYQMLNDCIADGIISAHNKTWKKLLGVK